MERLISRQRKDVFIQQISIISTYWRQKVMRLRQMIFIVSILHATAVLAMARQESTWIKDNNQLKLKENGAVTKSIDLYEERGEKPIDIPGVDPNARMLWGKESKAIISDNGKFAVHIRRDYQNWGEGAFEATTTVRYLNYQGELLWERHAVDLERGIHLSTNGKRIFLTELSEDGCSTELEDNCSATLKLLDDAGKEILRLGPYRFVDGLILTSNGKFGKATVNENVIFFNSESKQVLEKDSREFATKGNPRLLENGTVEVVREYYKDAAHRHLDHEEVVETFQIP